jgi:hypothetical protein
MLWLLIFAAVLAAGAFFGHAYQRHLDVLSGPWIAQKTEETPKSEPTCAS